VKTMAMTMIGVRMVSDCWLPAFLLTFLLVSSFFCCTKSDEEGVYLCIFIYATCFAALLTSLFALLKLLVLHQ